MSLRIPSPKALTKPEAYLAYKAGIMSRDELKQNLYNPLNNYEGWLAKWCGLLETYPTNKDGTPQCLTDEEGLLAYLCGVTDRYPASNSRPDDARISAYIRYLVSARYTRPDHPLNREEFYLSLIKTQFIPSGDPSSDIVIDGTAKAPFVDVKMYGDTLQNGTPTPEEPVPIQTVTGLQTVEVQGKNLLKLNDGTTTLGGVPITTTNGTVNLRGTATSGAQGYYVSIGITASEPMVFSVNRSGAMRGVDIKLQFKRGETTYYPTVFDSYRLQAGDVVQLIYLIISNGSVFDGSFSPMLEAGSTATSFEPYSKQSYTIDLGNVKLCKLDTYQDYIYKDGEDWKIHQNYLKIAELGDSSWIWDATIPRFSKNGAGLGIAGVNADTVWNAVSNKFIAGSFDQVYTNKTNGMTYSPSGFISVVDTSWTDETTARASLSGGVIYCRLRAPTDTIITDTNLIAQLEALVNGGSEEGTTYIKVSATEPNLPAKLYVEAPKYD